LDRGILQELYSGIKNYGDVKTDYILVRGSIQGSAKRPLIATHNLRKTKKQLKKDYELLELRK
jgi:ribosomal protein L3